MTPLCAHRRCPFCAYLPPPPLLYGFVGMVCWYDLDEYHSLDLLSSNNNSDADLFTSAEEFGLSVHKVPDFYTQLYRCMLPGLAVSDVVYLLFWVYFCHLHQSTSTFPDHIPFPHMLVDAPYARVFHQAFHGMSTQHMHTRTQGTHVPVNRVMCTLIYSVWCPLRMHTRTDSHETITSSSPPHPHS